VLCTRIVDVMWSNGFEIFRPRILSMLSETTLTVQIQSLGKIYQT
jgi:hypothetical protein